MKKNVILFVGLLLFVSCQKQTQETVPSGFYSEVMLPMTPVKDQGKSELCWVYAMLATIETEHLNQGDSVNLSVDYVARMYLEQQAMEKFQRETVSPPHYGGSREGVSMRGMGPMAIDLIEKYGILPYDSYYPKSPVNYNVLVRKLEKTVDVALTHRYSKGKCLEKVQELLDKEIGYLPRYVFMFGMQYTFLEFAHSVCMPREYMSLTCISSESINKVIELPFYDNFFHSKALNIEPDSLVDRMEKSLREGHPLMWEGGPNDNHAVSIIGMGKDKDGEEYFVAKNSWGTNNPTKGLLYISKDYVRDHTSVLVIKQ